MTLAVRLAAGTASLSIEFGSVLMKLTNPRLLITDDDRAFRETLGSALDRFGFELHLASDGDEALEVVRSHEVHLALFDVHMPRLSGLDALAQMRAAGLVLPCILMSAAMDDEIRARASEMDVVSIMTKPFKLRELSGVVVQTLSSRYDWVA